jgi:hypothetical protein
MQAEQRQKSIQRHKHDESDDQEDKEQSREYHKYHNPVIWRCATRLEATVTYGSVVVEL